MDNDAIEEFVYAASHDLKSPLRAIDNLAKSVEEGLASACPGPVAEDLEQLRLRVRRMNRLVDDLAEYVLAGLQRQPPEAVDLPQLCRGIVESLPPSPGIQVHIEPAMPPLKAEAGPLRQALGKLVSNALRYHGKAAGKILISAKDLGGAVEISVADDGPGIDPKHQEAVFQAFRTLQPKDGAAGSGLGLALARKILEQHGGSLKLQSTPGQGSVFTAVWPKGA